MSNELRQIPIIVLCGGLGTRLQGVLRGMPKILALIGDKTLLDITMSMLTNAGFGKIILSVGHLKKHIKKHTEKHKYQVIFSEEEKPLGTGGAIKKAFGHIGDAPQCFIMNGDMIFSPDFNALRAFHNKKGGLMSMMLTRSYIGVGGNVVHTNKADRIIGWRKKTDADAHGMSHLNAGTYIVNRAVTELFPNKSAFSLEDEFFPTIFRQPCYGLETDSIFIDIGVPERYRMAQRIYPMVG